jgi:hypothetical protein
VYRTYNVTYTYTLGYAVNSSLVTSTSTHSLKYTVRDYDLETLSETCREGGYFRDIGPLGRACVTIYKSGYTEVYENETHIVYTSQYYIDEAWIEKWTRGLSIPRQVDFTIVQNGVNALSGVESTMEIASRHNRLRLNETGVLFTTNISLYGTWGITEPVNLSDRVTICGGIRDNAKCINITRNVRFANVTVNVAVKPPRDWDWGTIRDSEVSSNITVNYNYPRVGGINTWRIREQLTPNPGALWLEKLTLRYIHDKLVEFIESTLMNNYRDAYLWLLATQIPIAMKNCDKHESLKPLLDALCEACGSDWERLWILGNITEFTLEVNTTIGRVMWSSLTRETPVETPIVYANISSYPTLWQLYNETLKTHLARPVGDKYLVYYDLVENTVFCDWERLIE